MSFETVHTCEYTQNTNTHEELSWHTQIFYICKPHFFTEVLFDFLYLTILPVSWFFLSCLKVTWVASLMDNGKDIEIA